MTFEHRFQIFLLCGSLLTTVPKPTSGGVINFYLGGYSPGVWGMKIMGDQSAYSGIQGEAPVVGLGDEVPQKLLQFADIVSRC